MFESLFAEMESMGQGLDGQNGRPCIGICFLRSPCIRASQERFIDNTSLWLPLGYLPLAMLKLNALKEHKNNKLKGENIMTLLNMFIGVQGCAMKGLLE